MFISNHDEFLSDPDAIVISDSNLMHAVNWFSDRYDVVLFGGPGEVAWGIVDQPERQVTWPQMKAIVSIESQQRPVVILLRNTEILEQLVAESDMPEPIELDTGNEIGIVVFGPSEG